MEARTLWMTVKRFPFLTGHPQKAKSKKGHETINRGIDVFW